MDVWKRFGQRDNLASNFAFRLALGHTSHDKAEMLSTGSQAAMGSQGALPAAAGWIEGVLAGSVGTAIAIIAIALTGFSLLSGKISWRRGLGVILGCFVIFGSSLLARDLLGLARATRGPVSITVVPPPPPAPPPVQARPVDPDPYAGASVPM